MKSTVSHNCSARLLPFKSESLGDIRFDGSKEWEVGCVKGTDEVREVVDHSNKAASNVCRVSE